MPFKKLYALSFEPAAQPDDNPSFLSPESQEAVRQIVLCLPERDREILCRRVGFYAAQETLEEIGASLGITKEAVRQRERRLRIKLQTLLADKVPEVSEP